MQIDFVTNLLFRGFQPTKYEFSQSVICQLIVIFDECVQLLIKLCCLAGIESINLYLKLQISLEVEYLTISLCNLDFVDMQSQIVCTGCRTVLLYPRGATNVCCAICNVITAVPPAGKSFKIHHSCTVLLEFRCNFLHMLNIFS